MKNVEVIVTVEFLAKGNQIMSPGTVLSVTPDRAKGMIAQGRAEYTDEQKKIFAAATATVPVVEVPDSGSSEPVKPDPVVPGNTPEKTEPEVKIEENPAPAAVENAPKIEGE